jgi:hypothetical protein
MRYQIVLLLAVFVLVGCSPVAVPDAEPVIPPTLAAHPIPTTSPFPLFSSAFIRLAWFYKPPVNGNEADLAKSFSVFILTKKNEAYRDALHAAGVRSPILQYLRFSAIMDTGDCISQPYRNQVADKPGDFCEIDQKHPDWFLLDARGERIYSNDYPTMDPANTGWRAFWLERARQSQEGLGWEGVFLDNVEASLGKQERLAGGETSYSSDAAYQDAVAGFLEYLYKGYFQPQGRPLFANIIETRDPLVWKRYLQFLDGAMLENFAVDWNGYLSVSEWEEQLKMVEEAQAMGKQLILVSQGGQDDVARQRFAFASYLLVTKGLASFRYADADYYNEIWLYDNYNLNLGAPLGERYLKNGVWQRDFEHATVTVDPFWHTAEITVAP